MAAYTTIDDPEAHFQAVTYTGNGSANHAITLGGDTDMQPDIVWIKNRDATDNHQLFDAVRGATKRLEPNIGEGGSEAETTDADTLDSFTSDGFQVDADVKVNTNAEKYVAWCWKANGTGSSNTDGAINTAATSANTTSGVSINTYEGTGSATTVGHGLGAVPEIIIIRSRDTASVDWAFFHGILGGTKYLLFNTAGAAGTASSLWNDTDPTSTVFTIGTTSKVNTDDENYVAYVFTSKQGFSKFGSYIGNGNADGTFIYTGFRPAWVFFKESSAADNWVCVDNKRNAFNPVKGRLRFDLSSDEDSPLEICDFLSNGFKLRSTLDENNTSGVTHIYGAFAEAPFVNSNGVPGNAR